MTGDLRNDQQDISAFYADAFDFPPARPDVHGRRYVIATSPRSGSTLLAMMLYQRIGFGLPLEYFNLDRLDVRMAQTGCATLEDYRRHVETRRSDDQTGVFGLKCFANFAIEMIRSHPAMHRRYVLDADVIVLKRRNLVEQAVSMARALQTGRWFANRSEAAAPRYNAALIARCRERLELQNRWWDNSVANQRPLVLYYEDLLSEPEETLSKIAKHLAVDRQGYRLSYRPLPTLQRDAISHDWVRRFNADTDQPPHA